MEVVFDQYRGINNVLTNYLMLKTNDKIGGGGQGFFLKAYPDIKFKQANLQELYYSDPDFKQAFDEESHSVYEKIVLDMSKTIEDDSDIEEAGDDDSGEMTVQDVIKKKG